MKNDYSRSITLQCSTCGGGDFEHDGDEGPVHCVGCNRNYTREELIRENGARIEAEVDEVKSEVLSDVRKEFGKIFKKHR